MIPVNLRGKIKENDNTIGECLAIKNVDLKENHCPQGYDIELYICKRCRHFKSNN
ncbi:hypothetical protein [Clostridium akagii]|uniref:hypothetical protein n=1 Tax=Clostridium akagii TaxID=91623 RepID=UPI000AA68C13|nr:hypothetical protein [Clostridium akagii]